MTKGAYVDGFLITIPKKNTAKYTKMAREGCAAWKKFGALDYKECIINDAKAEFGGRTFAKLCKAKPSEAVWFSFITYKSRKHRDVVNKKVMAYFEKKYSKQDLSMPFDMKAFSHAGFKVVVGM